MLILFILYILVTALLFMHIMNVCFDVTCINYHYYSMNATFHMWMYVHRKGILNLCMAIFHSLELTSTFSFEIIIYLFFPFRLCPWRSVGIAISYACIYVYATEIRPTKWNVRNLSGIFDFRQSIFPLHFILCEFWVLSAIESLFVIY